MSVCAKKDKKSWPVLAKGFLQSAKTATAYAKHPVPSFAHLPLPHHFCYHNAHLFQLLLFYEGA